jgi:hypothetical protein
MFATMQLIDVSAVLAYTANPQSDLSDKLGASAVLDYTLIVENAAGDAVVNFSDDGVRDIGQLNAAGPNKGLGFVDDIKRVWLKKMSGTNPISVRVIAKRRVQ